MDALQVVQRHLGPVEGVDVVPVLRALLERLERADLGEREEIWLSDPAWSLVAPEVEIRATGPGGAPVLDLPVFRGREGVMDFWRRWFELWESYSFSVVGQRDLGGNAILTEIEIQAVGRGGIPVDQHLFEIRRVRNDLIVSLEVFGSERAATRAVRQESADDEPG